MQDLGAVRRYLDGLAEKLSDDEQTWTVQKPEYHDSLWRGILVADDGMQLYFEVINGTGDVRPYEITYKLQEPAFGFDFDEYASHMDQLANNIIKQVIVAYKPLFEEQRRRLELSAFAKTVAMVVDSVAQEEKVGFRTSISSNHHIRGLIEMHVEQTTLTLRTSNRTLMLMLAGFISKLNERKPEDSDNDPEKLENLMQLMRGNVLQSHVDELERAYEMMKAHPPTAHGDIIATAETLVHLLKTASNMFNMNTDQVKGKP